MPRRCPSRRPSVEALEDRVCLAASVGWDGSGLGSASLSYYIGNAPSSLGQAAVNAAIRAALDVWSAVADVTFTQTSRPNQLRSLDFTFRRLDGAGGTLAQAYLPADVNPARIAGDVQFDASERWEVGNAQGRSAYDLVLTAVHEIGHALGLDHSAAAGSVMKDTISASQSFTALAAADVSAILSLYAPTSADDTATTPVAATETPETETPPARLAPRPRFWWFWRPRATAPPLPS